TGASERRTPTQRAASRRPCGDAWCGSGSAVAEPGHPARLQEPAGPVAGVELGHGHVAPGAGGMQEAALADVDADMVDALATAAEEHQVAGHQGRALDLLAVTGHVARNARQLDAQRGPEHVADQAAAVEPGLRAAAAPAVGR